MQIKILTINIWFGGKVWDNLVEFIHTEKPDILTIQEVYDSKDTSFEKRFRTMDEFKKEFFPFLPYSAFGATVIDTGYDNVPWGNAIFSKFPINNSRTIFFDLPLTKYNFRVDSDPKSASEGMLESEIQIGDKKAFVYSWHGVWDHHGEDTTSRKIMEDAIINSIKEKENVILSGDSNIYDDTETIGNIEKYLNNIFKGQLKSTFNMKYKDSPSYATASVDKIMVTPNIKVVDKSQPIVDISDHYPLIAILEL